MSKQLFEFVKVAAGEPFPFENGRYSGYKSAFSPDETEANDWHKGEVIKIVDWFILRPAESPDAGREEFIEKVIKKAIEVGGIHYRHDEFADFMRSNWPLSLNREGDGWIDPVDFYTWVTANRWIKTLGGTWRKETFSEHNISEEQILSKYKEHRKRIEDIQRPFPAPPKQD